MFIFIFSWPLWVVALLFLELCFIIFAIDDDDDTWGTGATISVLFVLGILQWFTTFKAFTFIKENVFHSVLIFSGYFIIGALWSVVKWWFAERARVRKAKVDYPKDWQSRKTVVTRHKSTFFVWIGYWPFSFVWTILNDPLKRLVRWIYEELQAFYQRITDHVWS